jgi:hypothetical protein
MNVWDTSTALPKALGQCAAAPTREYAQNCAFGVYHALVDLDARGQNLPMSICKGFALSCWTWVAQKKPSTSNKFPFLSKRTCPGWFNHEHDIRACIFRLSLELFPVFLEAWTTSQSHFNETALRPRAELAFGRSAPEHVSIIDTGLPFSRIQRSA